MRSLAGLDEVGAGAAPRSLRLRLRMDLDNERMRPLAALPWELLYDPRSRDFYGQGRQRLLVRHLAAPESSRPLAVTPPLRILAVSASPEDQKGLDLKQEVEKLRTALAGDERLKMSVLSGATREGLHDALRRERPHILHFMGHGGFNRETGEGFLCLENTERKTDEAGGELLTDLLKGFPEVRLVVLNACKTAKMSRRQGHTPYTTVGAALSLAGIPAVVAMQFSISDPGAIRFSQIFYETLAAGDPVDVATGEGRHALYVWGYRRRAFEWAAPVLFLRAEDGRIFDLPDALRPAATSVEEEAGPSESPILGEPAEDTPLLLGIRSREPLGDRPDPTLDLTRHFNDRSVRDVALWETAVLPELKDFLWPVLTSRRPLLLDFAAHASIAFAAGWVLEAKSGLDVAIRQRLPKGASRTGIRTTPRSPKARSGRPKTTSTGTRPPRTWRWP